jgi:aconitase B
MSDEPPDPSDDDQLRDMRALASATNDQILAAFSDKDTYPAVEELWSRAAALRDSVIARGVPPEQAISGVIMTVLNRLLILDPLEEA